MKRGGDIAKNMGLYEIPRIPRRSYVLINLLQNELRAIRTAFQVYQLHNAKRRTETTNLYQWLVAGTEGACGIPGVQLSGASRETE